MDSKTRVTLLDRLREGADPLVWHEFSDRYWRLIYGFAKRRGCADHTAEEVVQEVMLEVFRCRETFSYDPGRGRFRDWLGGMVRHLIAGYRRQPAQRVRGVGGDSTDERLEPPGQDREPEDQWEADYEEAMLGVLLDVVRCEVTPESYQAFELVAIHGLSGDQAARVTGLSRNAVYLARRRVFERLQSLGMPYREKGQLHRRIKEAMASRPPVAVERSVISRLEQTRLSRQTRPES